MALIDNLKRAVPKALTSADIAAQLHAAETSLAELEAKRDAASLDALIDAPGAKDDLARLNNSASAAREQIETLRAAHRAAVAREQEAGRKIRRDAIRHAAGRVKAHLKARDEAAAQFSEAIEKAAAAYAKIFASDEAARTAHGIANIGEFPIEAFNNADIERLAAGEMWRNTPCTKKGDVIPGLALPAAAFPQIEYQHWPQGVPALKETFEANSAAVLAILAPKVPD